MADKLEINVEVTNPQAQLDKILANISSSVTRMRRQFEKDIEKVIAKSGIKEGSFKFIGPEGNYDVERQKFTKQPALPNLPIIRVDPLTKTVDVAKQYAEQIKAQMQQFASSMARAKKLGRVNVIEQLLKQYEDLYSESVQKRVPKQIWNNIEQNWLKYNDALEETRKRVEDRTKKETTQVTRGRRDVLANVEKYADRYQNALNRIATTQEKTTRKEISDRTAALSNVEKYADRYQSALNRVNATQQKTTRKEISDRTSALANVEKYADRYQSALSRIATTQQKTTRKEISDRTTALAYAEELYTRNQEAKIKQREDRDKLRSRQVMGLASAGIGIFGQAGFPLLNIAFASMSGMKYAGIAAVATAAGEAARFIIRLQDAAKQSADSLGFVSKEAKIAAARFEATKVMYGVVVNMAEQSHMNRAREQMTGNYSMQRANSFWANYRMVAYEQMTNLFLDFGAFVRAEGMANQAKRRTNEQMPKLYEELMKAREEYIKNSFQYKATFDSPEGMWKRIQSAAMSRMPSQEELRRETLKEFDKQAQELQREQNALLRGNNKALEENTKRVLENRGGGYFSFG